MLVRRFVQRAAVIAAAMAAAFATTTPAYASPSSFSVSYSHAGGAVAVATQGGFSWTNRSVVLDNPRLYVINGECGTAYFYGFFNDGGYADEHHIRVCNGTGVSQYFTFADHTLDGSCCVGGIRRVAVVVLDDIHGGSASKDYFR